MAGTPNKSTSALRDLVEAEADAPLPVLLTRIGIRAMKSGDDQLAVNALSRAAAYVYPRVSPSELVCPVGLKTLVIELPSDEGASQSGC